MHAVLLDVEDLGIAAAPVDPIVEDLGIAQSRRAEILTGVALTIRAGEVHALMGAAGSGKSTLASTLMGSPEYEVTSGQILFKGDDITDWAPDVRAKAGMFLSFQDPREIAGVSMLSFLHQALSARRGIDSGGNEKSVSELRLTLIEWMDKLGMDTSLVERYVNEGFSTEAKKRNELLQLAVLDPEIAILDETHSEVEIDSLAAAAEVFRVLRAERPELATLSMMQDPRLVEHLEPDYVHVLHDGQMVASGGPELGQLIERSGYESFR